MFSFHHVALSVSNLARSRNFYQHFGYQEVLFWESDAKDVKISHMKNGESYLELFCYSDPQAAPKSSLSLSSDLPRIGIKHFGLKVEAVDATLQQLKADGFADESVTINEGRTGVRYFFLKDPDGILYEILEDHRGL